MRLTPMRKNATNVGNSTTPAAGTGEKKPLSLSKNAIKCRKKRAKKAEEKKLEKEEAACHGELQLAKLANQKKRLQASLLREVDDNSATSLGAPWRFFGMCYRMWSLRPTIFVISAAQGRRRTRLTVHACLVS